MCSQTHLTSTPWQEVESAGNLARSRSPFAVQRAPKSMLAAVHSTPDSFETEAPSWVRVLHSSTVRRLCTCRHHHSPRFSYRATVSLLSHRAHFADRVQAALETILEGRKSFGDRLRCAHAPRRKSKTSQIRIMGR